MSRSVDIETRAPAPAASSSEARPAVLSERLMAGVRVPDSPLIAKALDLMILGIARRFARAKTRQTIHVVTGT